MKGLITALLLSTTNSFSPSVTRSPFVTFCQSTALSSTVEPSPPPSETSVATATETPPSETTPVATATSPPPATDGTSEAAPAKKVMTSNQEKYGLSLELPDTYVRCGRCSTAFAMKAEDLGARGRRVSCSLCVHSWYQTPERLFTLKEDNKLTPLPDFDKSRISQNIEAGRDPDFKGETKFYVGNLDFGVDENDLLQLFTAVGPVGDVHIAIGPDGRRRGFAFVTMMEKDSFDGCMELDGKDIKGREISVKPPN